MLNRQQQAKEGTMKRLIFLFYLLLSILLPAACTPAAAPTAADNPQTTDTVDTSASAAVAAGIDTSDLTLIGQTGRPQFLNAYASW